MTGRTDDVIQAVSAAIDAGGPAVAIFDLDRTLLPGSSLAVFARRALAAGLVPRRDVARFALDESIFRLRGSTDSRIRSVSERALALAAGVRADDLLAHVAVTADEVADRIRPLARRILDLHRRAGHACIILSASPQPLVERIATRLGIERGVGTVLEVVDGVLTGRTVGPLCYGEGKLERLATEAGEVFALTSHAYADSISDLPVLQRADHPVAVGPDAALRAEAERRQWPVVEVRKRGTPWTTALGGPSGARRDGRRLWSASGWASLAGR